MPSTAAEAAAAAFLLSLLGMGAGCSSIPASPGARELRNQEILAAADPLGLTVVPATPAGLYALDAAMEDFVATAVAGAGEGDRLRALLRALLGRDGIRVAYGADTRSAVETFHRREGNCLAFTNLFVALARQAGLDVRYQEVDLPPDWVRPGIPGS